MSIDFVLKLQKEKREYIIYMLLWIEQKNNVKLIIFCEQPMERVNAVCVIFLNVLSEYQYYLLEDSKIHGKH